MPERESLAVTVRITVEVDGHTLNFEESGVASGGRYHGEDPRVFGYASSNTLESNVRGTVDTCIARATKRATAFVENAYPTYSGVFRGLKNAPDDVR